MVNKPFFSENRDDIKSCIPTFLNNLKNSMFIKQCTDYYKLNFHMVKKLLLTILMIIPFTLRVFAPAEDSLLVFDSNPVEPFQPLIMAIGRVENNGDTLAYNPLEEAAGFFQIRPVRINDYNKRTGSNYTLNDMFNYKISEKVFLYYASQIGHHNFEKIAKRWNGSGPRTIDYWDRVKKHL